MVESADSSGAGGADMQPGSRPWLHVFAMVTRAATLSLLTKTNTCIATTAIGAHVLGRYGIKARPQSVWVSAINAKGYLLQDQGIHPSQWPDDAWSVGISPHMKATDVPHDGAGWTGHLVLVVRRPGEPRLLIDLTADQFDRPHRSLVVGGPVFMDIPSGKPWTPQDPLFTVIGSSKDEIHEAAAARNATIVNYAPSPPGNPTNGAWKQSPDWLWLGDADAPDVKSIVDQICERIDAEVTSGTGVPR